jgi:hypothetical protein
MHISPKMKIPFSAFATSHESRAHLSAGKRCPVSVFVSTKSIRLHLCFHEIPFPYFHFISGFSWKSLKLFAQIFFLKLGKRFAIFIDR